MWYQKSIKAEKIDKKQRFFNARVVMLSVSDDVLISKMKFKTITRTSTLCDGSRTQFLYTVNYMYLSVYYNIPIYRHTHYTSDVIAYYNNIFNYYVIMMYNGHLG